MIRSIRHKTASVYLNGSNRNIRKHNEWETHRIEKRQSDKCFAGCELISSEDVDSKCCDSNLRNEREETQRKDKQNVKGFEGNKDEKNSEGRQ